MSRSPSRLETKAMRAPSGDQRGVMSLPGALVRLTRPVPSRLILAISSSPVPPVWKTICAAPPPSGVGEAGCGARVGLMEGKSVGRGVRVGSGVHVAVGVGTVVGRITCGVRMARGAKPIVQERKEREGERGRGRVGG